ncbi:Ankyrin [Lachnellula occidentalis]|uniref:Ankyrin n=1 Tax=Lachnellula occidentalis TaxID=215460 RepID=A0A8H8UHR3_9HELO|nr:Ankyrin [Lachnellula occidentalis]
MDPLSIIAGTIAIFDALKEAYRFADDVLKAPAERDEFTRRLLCVADIKRILADCLAQEEDPEHSHLVQILDIKRNTQSPLVGLLEIMNKMLEKLRTKETTARKWKDFKWHSEKKSLEGFFVAIDGCCTRISLVLNTANIRLSSENNVLLKKMAAKQDMQIEQQSRDREETERKAIERWLSPLDNQARQREVFEGAARPTVLSSIVADHLAQETSPNIPVLCLFIEKSHSPNNLLGSLVKQLVQLNASGISPEVRNAWKKETRVDARPSEAVLAKLLKVGCKVQGLKCTTDPEHEVCLPPFIEVQMIVPPEDLEIYVKAFIRQQYPEDNIDTDMETKARTSTKLGRFCAEDDEFFNDIVHAVLENSCNKFLLAKLYMKSITNKVTKKEIMGALKKLKGSQYDISDRIDILYDKDLDTRIRKQDPDKVDRAIKLLSIVYFARRNLTLDELSQVWAAEVADPEDTDYDKYGKIETDDILNSTGGFITVGREDTVVRLDDRTLREYFDKKQTIWFPEGENYIARLCLRYLGFDTFSKRCPEDMLAERDNQHPFFAYAVQYWGDHVREAGPEVVAAAVKYLEDKPRMEAYIQGAWETNTHDRDKWDVRRNIHALHVCAWFDLAEIIAELNFETLEHLDDREKSYDGQTPLDVQEKTYGQTPLMYACRRGNVNVAKRLLRMGANVNIRSARGRTALHEAVLRKNNEIVHTLLENAPDLDVNIGNPTNFDRSALMVAILQGSADMAQTILKIPDASVDIDMQDSRGSTALSFAALKDQGDIVDILLKSHAKMELTETSSGRSAMIFAIERHHSNIVSSLLSHGADPNLPKDIRGRTPALAAAERGCIEILETLIEYKADLSCSDEDGRTLMHCAAEYGHVDVLELLKSRGLELNSPCLHGMTPLHSACRMDRDDAAEFLVENGADCSIKDKFDRTPYMVAWQYGNEYLMDLLRDTGTNREIDTAQNIQLDGLPIWSLVTLSRLDLITGSSLAKTGKLDLSIKEPVTGNTALHLAILYCNGNSPQAAPLLKELLNADAKYIDEPNRSMKQTPLHIAVTLGCLACTEMLLKFKPKLDLANRYGDTPLEIACRKSNLDIAVTLVEAGASLRDAKFAMQKLLFAAIEFQSVIAVHNLMMAGADRMAQDEYGRTADIVAKRVDDGDGRILSILRSNRSFMYHAVPMKMAVKSTVSEVGEVDDEDTAQGMVYRPAFPRPAGLDEDKLMCPVVV